MHESRKQFLTLGILCVRMISTGLFTSAGKDFAACRHLKNHPEGPLTFVGGPFTSLNQMAQTLPVYLPSWDTLKLPPRLTSTLTQTKRQSNRPMRFTGKLYTRNKRNTKERLRDSPLTASSFSYQRLSFTRKRAFAPVSASDKM